MTDVYQPDEKRILLDLARRTLTAVTAQEAKPDVELSQMPLALVEHRACFVTLRRDGTLRGCTGSLVARRPLALEVVEMTAQTALYDPRFYPVSPNEVPDLHIEISILTPPQPLEFTNPDDLLRKLRPGVDGVTLHLENSRATFLPQVWESYWDPQVFLGLLCEKMGRRPDAWCDPRVQVETYQAVIVEEEWHHRI